MPANRETLRRKIQSFDIKDALVGELGWDIYDQRPLEILFDCREYILNAVAEKRGMVVYVCKPDRDGKIPEYKIRKKIDHRVGKIHYEHIIIYIDADKTVQTWQWVRRKPGKPAASREHSFYKGGTAENLVQRLERLEFLLGEEDQLDIFEVTSRARAAFDLEKVTKRFYDRFKNEHKKFLDFIKGIKERTDLEWYASLMLNRMMFIYFIQKKGFLDGDINYLRNRLRKMREDGIKGMYHDFYRLFLLRLFHEGFGQPEADRKPELAKLLGKIPFLNGGLFDVHELERQYPEIKIPDEAFEQIFDFFDEYNWYLEERPLRADNEINPDVLGYIFEKYINQKQMGAYYTKEDITGYISRNTVIPYLFDQSKKECNIAFDSKGAVWGLLRQDPDRYIYKAVRHGVTWDYHNDCPLEEPVPLPPEIEDGLDTEKPNLIKRRKAWNTPAPPKAALPTEIWREVVARRQRYQEVKAKMEAGEITNINDLITYNLDIQQFAQDVIENCEGPELLRAFWVAIHGRVPDKSNQKFRQGITVLDPACGSGAFLFAALNILEPLYTGCLERMRRFIEERLEGSKQFKDFENILADVNIHPNENYFIFKSIVINNLYGVDIMAEAVEICKLRLFLKLVAQVDNADQIEPLPDIDFNIRAGNTLVGFATEDEIKKALSAKLDFEGSWNRIKEKAELSSKAFRLFREMQTKQGMSAREFREAKFDLNERLDELRDELDHYLAIDYGENPDILRNYKQWRKSHQPFHWLVEFYGIMSLDGFDVIIGNPPYVEYSKVQHDYTLISYETINSGNLYSYFYERSIKLCKDMCWCGLIVPISSVSTPRMKNLISLLHTGSIILYISNYAVRPGKLFEGVDMNLTIIICKVNKKPNQAQINTTQYRRWYAEFRPYLFSCIKYLDTDWDKSISAIPKFSDPIESVLWSKIAIGSKLSTLCTTPDREEIYVHSGGRYFRKCLLKPLSNEYRKVEVPIGTKYSILGLLSSNLYYWYWIVTSDTYHVTKLDIENFHSPKTVIKDAMLLKLGEELISGLWEHVEVRNRVRRDGTVQRETNFRVGLMKPVIDQIDNVLANHYGFTDEELDFIINYDIKYRMGQDLGGAEDTNDKE